jgi:DNA polymerase III delta subunit
VGEGSVLFALTNLFGGALGGWSRYRSLSEEVRRRMSARRIAQGLDLLFRVERAWKSGRAEAETLLEHATQVLCTAEPSAAGTGTPR